MISPAENQLVDGGVRPVAEVRGPRAAGAAPVHLCRHCGAPLRAPVHQAHAFCCAGCRYVFGLVHENGLDGYYRIRDAVVPPAGEVVFEPRDYDWLREMVQGEESEARDLEPGSGSRKSGAGSQESGVGVASVPGRPGREMVRRRGRVKAAEDCRLQWASHSTEGTNGISPDRCDGAPGARSSPPAPRCSACVLTLEVQGISCAGCVWLIEKVFLKQPGALAIETDAQLGRVRIKWRPREFDAVACAKTLQSFGYVLGPPGEEPAVPESRMLARRIGLSAAFAMNVMLFTLPAYFGMEAGFPYARLFGTLSFGFATLSLLAGGSYFLVRAVRALRDGVMHIDLPIAVGIAGSFAASAAGWLSGQGDYVYFDFVAMFILLMLVGRWAQVVAVERNRRRLLSGQPWRRRVRIVGKHGAISEVAPESLRAGHEFLLRPGMVAPVESQLVSPVATFGTSWITGESEPRMSRAGAVVPAGAANLGRTDVRLRSMQPWSDSLLARLLQPAHRDAHRHGFMEKVVRGYLVAIFVAAVAAGIGWWLETRDAGRAWGIVTAVLVVSCPCAIGLAFPLADEIATTVLRRDGVFIREEDLWPRLSRIRRVVFDKTGTLTMETPRLLNPAALEALTSDARRMLHTLVADTAHPVSQCLRENLIALDPVLVTHCVTNTASRVGEGAAGLSHVVEEPGIGVSIQSETGRWSLGRPASRSPAVDGGCSHGHDSEFACDGVVLARFRFEDEIRADAEEEVAALQVDGLEIHLLSGDREEKVAAMAVRLGISPENTIGAATPRQKAAWLESIDRKDTLMLGDGANDSLAFDLAFARGTPVIHRGILEGKADFYYLGRGIGGIRRLLAVDRVRRRTQAALLIFSVAYNITAVGLAIAGWINPLVAAVLMPLSSLATLVIVAIGMRRAKNTASTTGHSRSSPFRHPTLDPSTP